MKKAKIFSLCLMFSYVAFSQDKDAAAKFHYTRAEEFYNQGTYIGAEQCIHDLVEAENILNGTNPKILYLKIKALAKSDYYSYDLIMALRSFYKITDTKYYPEDKYAEILKIGENIPFINDTSAKIKKYLSDSSNNKNGFFRKYSPGYKYSEEGYLSQGIELMTEGRQLSKGNDSNSLNDPGYNRARFYLKKAAEMGNKLAMWDLSELYLYGQGTLKDPETALSWAVRSGDSNIISTVYFQSPEVIKDGQKVINWGIPIFENSKSFTAARIAFIIARIYEHGSGGIITDHYKAIQWYIKSDNIGAFHCRPFIDHMILFEIDKDDKHIQKEIGKLYNQWFKTQR